MFKERTRVMDYQRPAATSERHAALVRPNVPQFVTGACWGTILLASLFFSNAEALRHNELIASLIALVGGIVGWLAFRRKGIVWLLLGALVPVLLLVVGSLIVWIVFIRGMAAF